MKALLTKVAPHIAALPLDQAILQLRSLLGQAQKDGALYDELSKNINALQDEILATDSIFIFAKEQMAELLHLAKCDSPADLPAIIDRFAEYQRLREKIVDQEEIQLLLQDHHVFNNIAMLFQLAGLADRLSQGPDNPGQLLTKHRSRLSAEHAVVRRSRQTDAKGDLHPGCMKMDNVSFVRVPAAATGEAERSRCPGLRDSAGHV
ncbi:MAG: hypothetical protein ACD_75C01617G0005 [uncultured bacterium]|nr:MAG: hypothetical protein ACD_75C01617G0005 [uncultured bacterium]